MTVYDYGQYKELGSDKRFGRIVSSLNGVSRKTKVRYAVVGGWASFLHTMNPPGDYPDLDIMLDSDLSGGVRFVNALRREPKFRVILFDDSGSDMFSSLFYDEEIQLDVFTDQKTREFLRGGPRRRGLPLEPMEPLIAEKIVRGSRDDLLMAVDLLATGRYDQTLLHELARDMRASGQIRLMERIASAYVSGAFSKGQVLNAIRRMRS